MITIKTTFEKIVKEVGSGGDTKEAVANFNAACAIVTGKQVCLLF